MKKKSGSSIWLLLLIIIIILLIIAGGGYYFYSKKDVVQEPEKILPSPPLPPVTEPKATISDMVPEKPEGPIERQEIPLEEPSKPELSASQYKCKQIEKDILDFFQYLDKKEYVKNLNLGSGSYSAFKKILFKLSSRTPIPAGEGIDSKILIKNLYHFFRVLDMKDLYLIKEVLSNEKETLEFHFKLFYAWFTLGENCPDPENIRPPINVLYKYAGFFLNTTGGRAYLSRRSPEQRILVTYYSVLIVHQADLIGKNNYGIDIQPFILPLKDEISHYTNLQFQKDYLNKLTEMEDYYLDKRG